jgi:hypothetical protein
MPGYGLAAGEVGLLPWSWANERLERAHNYWVATTSPDGVPHLAAVWGVWVGGALYFSTGGASVKARNLTADAGCVVAPEHADESVVVHGVAERVGDPAALDFVARIYAGKYGSGWPEPAADPVFAVAPRVVIGLDSEPARFTTSATRWRFATIDVP